MSAGVKALVVACLKGDRRAVAKLISIVEDGGRGITEVMQAVFPHTGTASTVGVTGAPGAGKSTLVDGLVGRARSGGFRVGVLAVDPSSPFTGGALLGDRVRMQSHTLDPGVYVRSMATRGHLGGLALATPEAVRILDAAGCDYVVIETVGVGQAEIDIVETADTTVVILNPGWGDAVQAAKAGLLEIADVFAVNKADRDGVRQTVRELNQMIDLGTKHSWRPPIVETVATDGKGVRELWAAVAAHGAHLRESGELNERRHARVSKEIAGIVAERTKTRVVRELTVELESCTARVLAGEIDPYAAAEGLLSRLESHGT